MARTPVRTPATAMLRRRPALSPEWTFDAQLTYQGIHRGTVRSQVQLRVPQRSPRTAPSRLSRWERPANFNGEGHYEHALGNQPSTPRVDVYIARHMENFDVADSEIQVPTCKFTQASSESPSSGKILVRLNTSAPPAILRWIKTACCSTWLTGFNNRLQVFGPDGDFVTTKTGDRHHVARWA